MTAANPLRLLRRLLRRVRGASPVAVSESRGLRYLHVGGDAIQSAMRIADPGALALDYTRCMMAFLLFHAQPREALLIGLGGGSLAKYLHCNQRTVRVRTVECNPHVIRAAEEHFALPAADARFTVELGDGAAALAPECCDLLMVDGFDDEALAPDLVSEDFYHAAWLALDEPGVLVANFMSDDPKLDDYLQRLERAFGGAVVLLPALHDPNLIAFALKGGPARLSWAQLRARAEKLERRHAIRFTRMVGALKRMNRTTPEALVIRGD